jgi:hypothetical protein
MIRIVTTMVITSKMIGLIRVTMAVIMTTAAIIHRTGVLVSVALLQ